MSDSMHIDKNDPLIWYKELVRFSLDTGSAPGLSGQREALESIPLTSDQSKKLAALDEEALEYIIELDWLDPDLLTDNNAKPLCAWWYHLSKIRNLTYPVELLPIYLQAYYCGSTR